MKQNDPTSINNAIKSIDACIDNSKKSMTLMDQLKYTLIRRLRALDSEFWFDKFKTREEKIKAVREEIELYKNAFGKEPHFCGDRFRYLLNLGKDGEFVFYTKRQWQEDRKKVLAEIEKEKSKL